MPSIGPVIRMVAQRSLGHWRLFCALSFGAVLCAVGAVWLVATG